MMMIHKRSGVAYLVKKKAYQKTIVIERQMTVMTLLVEIEMRTKTNL